MVALGIPTQPHVIGEREGRQVVHASCVAIGGHGVLIVGPSGSGKSSLALLLIDRGGLLVADDCTTLRVEDHDLLADAVETVRGLLEVRGVGLVEFPAFGEVAVRMIVALGSDAPGRLGFLDIDLPAFAFPTVTHSTPIAVERILKRANNS